MIRVSAMYPNAPGRRFDWKYFIEKHMAMAHQILDPFGARAEVDRGIGTIEPGAQAPFVAICHMYFKSMEDLQRCMSQAPDTSNDIPNFTDAQPLTQISEIL